MFDASKIVGISYLKYLVFQVEYRDTIDKKAISKIVKSTIENEIYTDEEAIRTSIVPE